MRKYVIFGCIGMVLLFVSMLPLWAGQDAVALKVGDKAPLFNANDHLGELWQASKVLDSGKFLVVYFYPAAMTGGCTKQACAYRDAATPLEREGIHVVGVSADPVKSLKYFRDAHGLNFPLLSDVNGYIAKQFGVPIRNGGSIKRTVEGKEVTLERPLTFARWTFVVNASGKIVYKNTSVNATKDSQAVIDFLKTQKSS